MVTAAPPNGEIQNGETQNGERGPGEKVSPFWVSPFLTRRFGSGGADLAGLPLAVSFSRFPLSPCPVFAWASRGAVR